MTWDSSKLKKHKEAAKLLNKIKDQTFKHISNNRNVTEYEVQQFILKKFKENGIRTDKDPPIVGFNSSSAEPHYFPKSKSRILRPDTLILIDIWAKLRGDSKAPFADITWMAYYGKKIPKEIYKVFKVVINARDDCIKFLRKQLKKGEIPRGKDVDNVAREVIKKAGYGKKFIHGTGHPLGYTSAHARGSNINPKGKQQLKKNIGYTIEPGIYLKNRFGVRSEIDFYIDNKMNLHITTPIQKTLGRIL